MSPNSSHLKELLREVLRTAQQVRARVLREDCGLGLRDVYTVCFELTSELRGSFPDAHIMVGDRVGETGNIQHHWIEIPSEGIYVDPACDVLDLFQAIRVGDTSDPDFVSTYLNGVDSNIDVSDPRNRPEVLFKVKSAWDSES